MKRPSESELRDCLQKAIAIREIVGRMSLDARGFAMAGNAEIMIALLEREIDERTRKKAA